MLQTNSERSSDDDPTPDMRRFQQLLAVRDAERSPRSKVSLAEARRIVESVREPLARGVPVELQRPPGAPHRFLEAMSFAPTAQRALAQRGAWLRREAD